MDQDGYFFITDRPKRMVNASGFKVWSAEVDALPKSGSGKVMWRALQDAEGREE